MLLETLASANTRRNVPRKYLLMVDGREWSGPPKVMVAFQRLLSSLMRYHLQHTIKHSSCLPLGTGTLNEVFPITTRGILGGT